jgi:endonuclease/exonuclease/phosphatase family metal-dependent hydrolase
MMPRRFTAILALLLVVLAPHPSTQAPTTEPPKHPGTLSTLSTSSASPGCLSAVDLDGTPRPSPRWAARPAADARTLAQWCDTVGPAVLAPSPGQRPPAPPRFDRVVFVSWNVHEGGGDLDALVADIRERRPDAAIVLMLQEVHRSGAAVPPWHEGWRVPKAIVLTPPAGRRRDIVEVARTFGYSLFYVPSMRNSAGLTKVGAEDRGNAVLSTLPLSDETAIELPFETDRRVALVATLAVQAADGAAVRIRVVTTHLDLRSSWRRGGLFFFPFGRARQTAALIQAIDGLSARDRETGVAATLLAGDFNTVGGDDEPALREAARKFPRTPPHHTHVTFPLFGPLGTDLDHVFVRGSADWRPSIERFGSTYGSDHYPLVATLSN